MGNIFLNLPCPAADGFGAAVDVSTMGALKTIVVSGSSSCIVKVQTSNDGVFWQGFATFSAASQGIQTLPIACKWMRAGVDQYISGTPEVDVGSTDDGTIENSLNVPALGGIGTPLDTSALPLYKTIQVGGQFEGGLSVEVSVDGVSNWSQIATFLVPGIASFEASVHYMRVKRTKRKPGSKVTKGNPVVSVAATNPPGGASGGGFEGVVTDNTMTGNGTILSPLSSLRDQFQPTRGLFLAAGWPVGANAVVFFTTFAAANAQAALLVPTDASQVSLQTYPSTYNEAPSLVSNVSYVGVGEGIQVLGNISWLAGQGVNASQAALPEQVVWEGMSSLNAATGTLTCDSTAKTAGVCKFSATRTGFQAIVATGRAAALDFFRIYDCDMSKNSGSTFTNMTGPAGGSIGVEIVGCRMHQMAFAGSNVRIEGGGEVFGGSASHAHTTTAQNPNPTAIYSGISSLTVPISAAAGCSVTIVGSAINANLTGAGAFDVRAASWSHANLAGITGTCNRTTWTGTAGITSGGAGATVNVVPAYPDTAGRIQLQLISGAGNVAATAAWVTGGQFHITDAVDGNTWGYTIIHD